jgi:hypothetical protein
MKPEPRSAFLAASLLYDEREFIGTTDAADLVGVCSRTIRNWGIKYGIGRRRGRNRIMSMVALRMANDIGFVQGPTRVFSPPVRPAHAQPRGPRARDPWASGQLCTSSSRSSSARRSACAGSHVAFPQIISNQIPTQHNARLSNVKTA